MTKTNLTKRLLCCLLFVATFWTTGANAQCIIGVGTVSTAGSGSDPIDGYFNYFRYQTVYTAAELTAGGMSAGSVINSLGFSVTETNGPGSIANYSIRLGHTAAANAAANITDPLTTVKNPFSYTPVVQAAGSFHMIAFDANFTWNGTSNIVVDICAGSIPYLSPYGGVRVTSMTSGSRRVRCDACGSQCGVATTTANTNRPNIRFDFSGASPCVGTPAPGNTTSTSNPVCSAASFTLGLQNSTSGTGVTYQWQADAGGGYSNVSGATNSTYTTSQLVATTYRCYVTCSAGPSTGVSNPLTVTMGGNCQCLSYCASNATNSADTKIDSIKVDGSGFGTAAGTCETYTLTTTAGFSWDQGSTHTMRIRNGSCSGSHYTAYYSVYIDYNQNGSFADAGETVMTGGPTTALNSIPDFNFTVPAGATLGSTRARVVFTEGIAPPPACGTYTYGETEDFCVTITAPPPCAGTPTPGNTISSAASVCTGGTVNLSLQNATSGTGVTYAWQSSPDNSTWTNTGGTASTHTSAAITSDTYFRCEVTCSSGPSIGYSNSVQVTVASTPVGGTASGPATALTYQNLVYTLLGSTGSLQWQVATAIGGPYADISGATTATLNTLANAAGTYYIRCRAYNPGCTDDYSNILTLVVTVAGDNVCDALPLSIGNNGPYTNIGATAEVGEVTPPGTGCNTQTGWCSTGFQINSVWFSFTAPASGRVSVRLNPNFTLWDSEFAIYSSANCADFTEFALVAANDDSLGSPFQSYITPVCLTPGATYYLLVDGYSTTTNGTFGILLQDAGYLNANTSTVGGTMSTCSPFDGSVTLNFTGTGPWTYELTDGTNYANGSAASSPYTATVPCGTNGAHTWTYSYVLDGACAQTYSGTATVNTSSAPPTLSVVVPIVGLPVAACNGTGPVAISIPAVPNATEYLWDAPAGSNINGAGTNYTSPTPSASLVFGPPSGSGYYIGVQAGNGCGTTTRKSTWVRGTVSVPASVTPTLTGQVIYCPNTLGATFTTPAVTGATSYLWTITGDATVSGTGTTATVDFGPTWTGGTLCVAAQTSCFTSATKCLALTYAPATIGAMSGTFTTCIGQSVLYSVPAQAGIASYNWTLPAGASGSSSSNSISVTFNPGFIGGNISVTATSICGITSAARTTTIYLGVPTQPASISGPSTGVCTQTVIYTCPNQAGVTFNWTVPAGTINSGQGSNAISVTFGTFTSATTVSVTASNACGSSPARTKTVNGYPLQPGAITSIPASWCANATGVEFNVDVTNMSGSYTLSWLYPGASVATYVLGGGNTTQLILDWITGSGPVNVTASNACGNATRTSTQANSCREGEGVVEQISNAINVYPNPTTGNVNIEFSAITKGNASVTIQDLAGRTVASQNISVVEGMNKTQLDLSKVSKGIYMMNVNSDEGTSNVKIVVE